MPGIMPLEGPRRDLILLCNSCGEDDNFVQVINYEVNRVNGNIINRQLIEAEVDHYFCEACGETVEPLQAYR